MGRYTERARRLRVDIPQDPEVPIRSIINNVKINNIHSNRDIEIDKPTSERPEDTLQCSSPVDSLQNCASSYEDEGAEHTNSDTTLRPTTLTTLFSEEAGVTTLFVPENPNAVLWEQRKHKLFERERKRQERT